DLRVGVGPPAFQGSSVGWPAMNAGEKILQSRTGCPEGRARRSSFERETHHDVRGREIRPYEPSGRSQRRVPIILVQLKLWIDVAGLSAFGNQACQRAQRQR